MNARISPLVLSIFPVLGLGCSGGAGPADPLPAPRLEKTTITDIDPTKEGTAVDRPQGVGVLLPANSLQAGDGSAPSGMISVELTSFAPSPKSSDMPGSFTGIGRDGETYALFSLGIIGIRPTDAAGRALNVKSGASATILVRPILPTGSAPPVTLPLWHLADGATVWREEGSAELVTLPQPYGDGTKWYRGEVSHFSLWNVDSACGRACVTVIVKDYDGKPIAGAGVVAKVKGSTCEFWRPGTLGGGAGTTDWAGVVTINGVPGGSDLILSVQRGDEVIEKEVHIPDSGDTCVDAGILMFSPPTTGPGGQCGKISGTGTDGSQKTFDVTRTLKGNVLGTFSCSKTDVCYDNRYVLNADGTGTFTGQNFKVREFTWGVLADPQKGCVPIGKDYKNAGYPMRDYTLIMRMSKPWTDGVWTSYDEGDLLSSVLTVSQTQAAIAYMYLHDCSNCL